MKRDDSKQYPNYLCRVEAKRYSVVIDADRELYGTSGPILQFYYFKVTRITPQGAWIDVWGSRRFVLLNATKKFATKTTDEAIASMAARKNRQIRILTARLQDARAELALLDDAIPGRTAGAERK